MSKPVVGIIMGSDSDLDIMCEAAKVLDEFKVPYEVRIISAHRTAKQMITYANEAAGRGLKVIIAGAGGSAHLPGMTASETTLPVLAVPVKRAHHDHEALWSSIAMPKGIPLAVLPENAADRAALLAVRILSLENKALAKTYAESVKKMEAKVLATDKDIQRNGWKKHIN